MDRLQASRGFFGSFCDAAGVRLPGLPIWHGYMGWMVMVIRIVGA